MSKDWKGAGAEDHTARRSKKGDQTTPNTDSAGAGLQERNESEGVANGAKSQATTERGGVEKGKQAKKEHPKAPEPIIGMNDERAQVCYTDKLLSLFLMSKLTNLFTQKGH